MSLALHLKHFDNNPDDKRSGPLKTHLTGRRTAIGVFRSASLRGQTVHSVHCKRTLQQTKIRNRTCEIQNSLLNPKTNNKTIV